MADKWGALAQDIPAATTLTDCYTVPALRRATVNVIACNRSGAATIRLAHSVGGAVDATDQYMLYDFPLGANDTKATEQIVLDQGDVLRVYSNTGTVAFNVNGIEEDR